MTRGKRPIDRQRDAAFQMSVGSFEDGAILEMITVGDALYLIAERAIHQAMLADQIDPDRKHPETPHTSQRVASAGAESPIVRRSFLQAAALFRTPYLGDTALSEAGLKTSFGFMQELLAAQQSLAELQAALQTAEKELPIKGQAVHLPSLADVSSRTEIFVHKAGRASQALYQMLKAFYGHDLEKGLFDGASKFIAERYGPGSPFAQFAVSFANVGKLIRNIRNAVEHPKPTERLEIQDYHFRDGALHRPSVRVVHPTMQVDETPLDQFMSEIVEYLTDAGEGLILHLAENHVARIGGLKPHVKERTDYEVGRTKVRFGYVAEMGGSLVPFG